MFKTSNVLFQGCEKHEAMFSIVSFLIRQILGIVGSHIKIGKKICWLEYFLTFRNVIYKLKI